MIQHTKILCLSLYFLCFFSFSLDFEKLPTFSKSGHVQMIVEIPAGTRKKYEYDSQSGQFTNLNDLEKERLVNYLPYPANYGFIPSTKMHRSSGGDGDSMDILLISEALHIGTIIDIKLIGILRLLDDGEKDYKLIAIPVDENKQISNLSSFMELENNYSSIKNIIEMWFLNYKGSKVTEFISWGDEIEALSELNRHLD